MAGRKRANGEGNIAQYPDGRWVARLSLPGGRRKAYYGKTRREVQQQLTAALRDQQQGLPIVGGRQTVGQFLEQWLENTVKPGVRPRTHEAYALNVRRLVRHVGKERLVALTPQQIQAAYGALLEAGLARRTVEQAHVVLHTALRYAVRARLLVFNPADAVTAPRPERREMRTLEAAQVQQMLDRNTDDRLHALWALLATTGLRLGEATGLRWTDLDLASGQLTVRRALQRQRGKGLVLVEPKIARSRRTLHLTSRAVDALRRHRAA